MAQENQSDFEVDITPSVTTYELYQIASYTHWFSIGEFIDNSITSAMQNWELLKKQYGSDYALSIYIDLDHENSTLTILDNAGGIKRTEIERALRAGEPPADTSWLSVHGVGMKMSAFWWGRNLRIQTWPIRDNSGYEVSVDLDEIKQTRSARMNVHSTGKLQPSGTLVSISKISEEKWPKGTGLGKLKSLLTSMYRVYLNDKDKPVKIFFNGKRMNFEPQPVLEAAFWANTEGPVDNDVKKWERDFSFTTSANRTIYGHVGLLARMSRDLSGFFLHYKGKGMGGIGYNDSSDPEFSKKDLKDSREYYRPEKIFGQEGSYRYQRFTGEFDISELGKTSSTDSIKWDSEEETEFLEALSSFLKDPDFNMWAMAQNFQQRKANVKPGTPVVPDETELTVVEINEISKHFFEGWQEDRVSHSDHDEEEGSSVGIPLVDVPIEDFQEGDVFIIQDSKGHDHSFKLLYLENPDYQLYELTSKSKDSHTIRLNTAHPRIRKLQWGNKDVREAAISMFLLMAIPEVFLPLRPNPESFRAKINELADAPRLRIPSIKTNDE
jgi:hypothetical protein